MKKIALIISLALLAVMTATGEPPVRDSLLHLQEKETVPSISRKEKRGIIDALYQFVKKFSQLDTNYVEPQKYNFEAMLQNTNTYEAYALSTSGGQHIRFSPDVSMRLGPYIGWRWIFLGYTLDLAISVGAETSKTFI